MGLVSDFETGVYTLCLLAFCHFPHESLHGIGLVFKINMVQALEGNSSKNKVDEIPVLDVPEIATSVEIEPVDIVPQKVKEYAVSEEHSTPTLDASTNRTVPSHPRYTIKLNESEDVTPSIIHDLQSHPSNQSSVQSPYLYISTDGSMDLIEDQMESDEYVSKKSSSLSASSSPAFASTPDASAAASSFNGTSSHSQKPRSAHITKFQRRASRDCSVDSTQATAMSMRLKGRLRHQYLVCSSASMAPQRKLSMECSDQYIGPPTPQQVHSPVQERPRQIGAARATVRRQESIRGMQRQNSIRSALDSSRHKPLQVTRRGLTRTQSVVVRSCAPESTFGETPRCKSGKDDQIGAGCSDQNDADSSSSSSLPTPAVQPRPVAAAVPTVTRKPMNRRMSISDQKMLMRMRSTVPSTD